MRQDETQMEGDAALIVALASGASKEDAARRAGISRATVYRRLDDPGFRAAVREERQHLIWRTVGRLSDAGSEAAAVLLSVATDTSVAPSARVAAARAILELGTRLRESTDLGDRLLALEAAHAEGALL